MTRGRAGLLAIARAGGSRAACPCGRGRSCCGRDLDPGERRTQRRHPYCRRGSALLVLLALALAAASLGFVAVYAFVGARWAPPRAGLPRHVRLIAAWQPGASRVPAAAAPELQLWRSGQRARGRALATAGRRRNRRADAKARVEQERNRLAALVAELDQSVLVCNLEGRILLYNAAAQALLGGRERRRERLLGLGRSVFGIIDRNLDPARTRGDGESGRAGRREGSAFRHRDQDGAAAAGTGGTRLSTGTAAVHRTC